MGVEHYYQHFLERNRYPRVLKNYDTIFYQNKPLINFSSSDYLGLAKHPLLLERSQEYAKKWGMGAGASRSVCGNFSAYITLEKKIASMMNKPTALILGAGYQANISVLEALLNPKVLKNQPLVFYDRFCHLSLLGSTRFLAHLHPFQHNNLAHLAVLLKKHREDAAPKFILVESVYSMEGDEVNFVELIRLAKKYHAFLYVDDAHAVGVYGEAGQGKAFQYAEDIDIIMGTFSKALGSFGGYIACSEAIRDYLINQCKGFIYSTGSSPAILGAIDAALDLVPQLQVERERVGDYTRQLCDFFRQGELNSGSSTTHIIPWIIGEGKKTVLASELLMEKGILATAIRPPSVPLGQSRIRFCLNATHQQEDMSRLFNAIMEVKKLIE